ncbi:MAG: hypothetical protein BWY79_01632 [Actinobacteria bacterium ADurb.Bin444]|nr:MAG: hypothetical protein BWY79_01632 [Actinobacteria bacterium ADurb.Bin444]
MLRRHHEESGSKEGIGARGEDGDLGAGQRIDRVLGRQAKDDVTARRFANPVALHGDDPFGPVFQFVEVIQQAFSVISYAEEPLLELFGFHFGGTALTGTLDDLLIGQHGLARRAPVDRSLLPESEALSVELQEEPLCPLVVLRPAGDNLTVPIDSHAQAAKLAIDGGDGVLGEDGGVFAGLYGDVLRVETEGVVTHGMQDELALVAPEARDHIAHGVVLDVSHVRAARRVGEHLQDIGGATRLTLLHVLECRIGHVECLFTRPDRLPLGLDLLRVVAARHRSSSFPLCDARRPAVGTPHCHAYRQSSIVETAAQGTKPRPALIHAANPPVSAWPVPPSLPLALSPLPPACPIPAQR